MLVLLALGKLQTGAERLLLFEDVVGPLTKLLMEFGPSRSSCHPEYPFWRLQNDGLWEVPEPSRFRRRKNNTDALKSELIRFHACGGFPQNIYETLKKRPEIVRGLAQEILAAHFPDSLHDAIASEVGLNLYGRERSSERDPAFRAAVLARIIRKGSDFGSQDGVIVSRTKDRTLPLSSAGHVGRKIGRMARCERPAGQLRRGRSREAR